MQAQIRRTGSVVSVMGDFQIRFSLTNYRREIFLNVTRTNATKTHSISQQIAGNKLHSIEQSGDACTSSMKDFLNMKKANL